MNKHRLRSFTVVVREDGHCSTFDAHATGYTAGSADDLIDASMRLVGCLAWHDLAARLIERIVVDADGDATSARELLERAIASGAARAAERGR